MPRKHVDSNAIVEWHATSTIPHTHTLFSPSPYDTHTPPVPHMHSHVLFVRICWIQAHLEHCTQTHSRHYPLICVSYWIITGAPSFLQMRNVLFEALHTSLCEAVSPCTHPNIHILPIMHVHMDTCIHKYINVL